MIADRCDEVRPNLEWFVGDDLDGASAATVRSHLRECRSCRSAAAALQQSMKGLRALGAAGHPDVDEAMFATMHASILERVNADARSGERAPRLWRALPLAAAAAIFVIGWWSVRDLGGSSVFERRPIPTLVDVDGPVMVVPWAGPRVPMHKLGEEHRDDETAGAVGPGMMGRWKLRTLEGVDAPARPALPLPVGFGGDDGSAGRSR